MNQLSDDIKKEVIRQAEDAGHPDPLGFVARIGVETKYDEDFEGTNRNRIGITQVNRGMAQDYGFGDVDTLVDNITAAIFVDLYNYKMNDSDIDKMYTSFNSELKKKDEEKYLASIENEKDRLQSALMPGSEARAFMSDVPSDAVKRLQDFVTGERSVSVLDDPFERQIQKIIAVMDVI